MSLYRYLGGAPAPLPSVAHDANGDGWTALDTLSPDDLAGLGFAPAPDQPAHDPATQTVQWDDGSEAWVVVDLPAPPEPTLEEVKAARLEDIAARRRNATSVVSVGPMTIPWNDTTENRVANAIAALGLKPEGAAVSWEVTRGVFATLDLHTLRAIGLAAFDRQQAAFDNVRTLTSQVAAAEDAEAVAAIDIEDGWP